MSLILLTVSFVIAYVLYYVYSPPSWSQIKDFNGPPVVPFLGCFGRDFAGTTVYEKTQTILGWMSKYASPVRTKTLFNCMVWIYKAEHVEKLVTSKVNITKAKPAYKFLEAWMGNGVLTSTGLEWHRQRKYLTPTFHYEILKDFTPTMDEHANKLCSWIANQINRGSKTLDIRRPVTMTTLDIIGETSMGVEFNTLDGDKQMNGYTEAIHGFAHEMVYRQTNPMAQIQFLYNFTERGKRMKHYVEVLHQFSEKVIAQKEAELDYDLEHEDVMSEKPKRKALMDLLLKMKRNGDITANELRQNIDTFMFAGHDTTSTAIMYACHCFAKHPIYQQTCYDEIVNVIGVDPHRDITAADLSQMPFFERCLKESQRIFPSVPTVGRNLEEDLTIEPGKTIPKGTRVSMLFYQLHRDPEQWGSDVEKFDPDRFLPENIAKRHPYSYTPFSAGARNCIGQKFAMLELKIIMARLLQRFKMSTNQKPEEMMPSVLMVLRPEGPVEITFELRD